MTTALTLARLASELASLAQAEVSAGQARLAQGDQIEAATCLGRSEGLGRAVDMLCAKSEELLT